MVFTYSKDKKTKHFPPTHIVVELDKKVKLDTAQWIVNKLVETREKGGAELLVRKQPPSTGKRLTLHVTASEDKILELAEEQEVRKKDKHGVMREFTLRELDEFIEVEAREFLLNASEKQVLIRHEIENLRALSHEICILGYPDYPLYEGQSIISACLHHGVINQIYPLHDEESIKKLGHSWFRNFKGKQPFEDIRLYFGESFTLYFQFLGFYTDALKVPMILGFLQMILYPGPWTLAVFCVLNMICASLFLELWRKNCSELAYIWGTISMTGFDEPRPNFRGVMGIDAVTGKLMPQAPRFNTHIKMYCVSLPLVFLCMIGAFLIMLTYFWIEDLIKPIPSKPLWIVYAPTCAYCIIIFFTNSVYRRFATFLTEWENHRTQAQFDRHRVTKLILFEFVNNFMCLFYTAFILQDIESLRFQIGWQLIGYQILNNIQEAFLPLVNKYFRKSSKTKKRPYYEELASNIVGIEELDAEDSRINQAISEGMMFVYDDPYDDYLEIFVQFGYVFLFSAVFPMAAFFAFANNYFEIRIDAYKLCTLHQRPMARKVKDTGAWQRAFQVLCALSVMTNCLLLSLSPDLKAALAPNMASTSWQMLFFLMEHLLLGLRQALHYAIPDKPEWVKLALAKGNYQSKQALKMQRLMEKRKASLKSEEK